MTYEKLTVRGIRVRPVNVPMSMPLLTGGGSVSTAPLSLIDLETEEGITGCAYVFCYSTLTLGPVARLIENLIDVLTGERVAPLAMEEKLGKTFRLIGLQGITAMAAAGIDMAAWDALAKAAGLPLARLLGGEPRPIQAYNSKGLGIIGANAAGEEAQRLLAEGFRAVKVRLGYANAAADLEVIRAVRAALGNVVPLMADYNQSLSMTEAQHGLEVSMTRDCSGSRSRCASTTTAAARGSGRMCARRSRSARTAGAPTTWPRRLKPAPVTTSCPTW